jgi:hypothetical protein
LEEDIVRDQNRVNNQLREQLHRFFPQLLQLSAAADEPWVWDLLQAAPSPAKAAKLTEARIARILTRHRIRRLEVDRLRAALAGTPLTLAPGAVEAASEHALLLLPRLRLLRQQRAEIARRIEVLLGESSTQCRLIVVSMKSRNNASLRRQGVEFSKHGALRCARPGAVRVFGCDFALQSLR